MAQTLVILNPNAGNGRASKTWLAIEPALHESGIEFDLTRTTAPHQADAFAEKAKRDGYETIISVGGDGTTNEIVNGLMHVAGAAPIGTLGIIPIGSGNDFAKMLAEPATPASPQPDWRAAVQRIRAGATRVIDVGRVVASNATNAHEHFFLNALDTGFGAHANTHAHEFPQLTGTAMYLAAIFKTLIKFEIDDVKVTLDDRVIAQTSTMLAITNGRCICGGFWIAPSARVDDGLLEVIVADGLGRAGILALLPKVMKGTHIGDPRVKSAQSARVVIESRAPLAFETDGEISFNGATRLEIQLLPKRLQILM